MSDLGEGLSLLLALLGGEGLECSPVTAPGMERPASMRELGSSRCSCMANEGGGIDD